MRKVFGFISRTIEKNGFFQQKAIEKIDEISNGKVVRSPNYSNLERVFKQQNNDKIREEVSKKNGNLIKNMNEITVKCTNPIETPEKQRELPKKPWEYMHDNKKDYEYGFYEPPTEKMEKNRIIFREALEILRARMEMESSPESTDGNRDALNFIQSCPAAIRVDKDKLDRMWEYFRPFAHNKQQTLVRESDLEIIHQFVEGADDNISRLKSERFSRLNMKTRQMHPDVERLRQIEHGSKDQVTKYQYEFEEMNEKSARRLQQKLKEFNESEDNRKKANKQKS